MIIKVLFNNGINKREIGQGSTFKECNQIINKFLKDHNYESYYWRFAYHNDHIWIDVGAWSQFFELWSDDIPNGQWQDMYNKEMEANHNDN